MEVHLKSVRISTADTNLPESLLDGLTAELVVVLLAALINQMQIRNFFTSVFRAFFFSYKCTVRVCQKIS